VTFQQEKTKRWHKYYFPSLLSFFNKKRCQAGRAPAPGTWGSSSLPLRRQLSPGWLISRMAQERLHSEHQPSKPRAGWEQPATPAKSICSPNAKSPASPSRMDFHPNSQAFHSSCKKSGKSIDRVRPAPTKREISREWWFPEGRDEAQQQQNKLGTKPLAAIKSRPPGLARAPRSHPGSLPPQKAAGSMQQSGSYKSFCGEKLCFRKSSGCNAVPPAPDSFFSAIALPLGCCVPGKGLGIIAGGCGIAGGSAALPPRLLLPLTKYLFNEGIPTARAWALPLRRARLPAAPPNAWANLRSRLRAPRSTDPRPDARVMATCSSAKTLCMEVVAPGPCRTERTKSPQVSPVSPRCHDTRHPVGHPCFQPRTAARDTAALIRCLIPPSR